MVDVITEKATKKKSKVSSKKRSKRAAQKKISNDPFKVLALDGGGIKGVYTAAVLDQLQ